LKKDGKITILKLEGDKMKILIDVLFFVLAASLVPLLFVVEEFIKEFLKG